MIHVDEVRNALVDRVRRLLPAERVGVPHGERLTAAVERAGLVAETEEVVVKCAGLAHGEARAVPLDRRGVALQDVALHVGHGELQLGVDADAQRFCGEAVGFVHDCNDCCARFRQNGPGCVFGFIVGSPCAHAEHVVAECGDLQRCPVCRGGYAICRARELLS